MEDKGFHFREKKIEGFSAKCELCGSYNVELDYEFNYYGGATGYDHELNLICMDCDNITNLYI